MEGYEVLNRIGKGGQGITLRVQLDFEAVFNHCN
jgi:hypothetical protein